MACDNEYAAMIAVIGCGNLGRTDDGLGPEVIRILSASGLAQSPGVRLLDAGTDGMAVMFAARGCDRLIIVDACRSGAEPGAIFEAPGAELESKHGPSLTLHDFRWNHALFAGRRLLGETFPAAVTVFLVEAGSVEFGIGLTPDVAAAASRVAERIQQLARRHVSPRSEAASAAS